MQNVGRSLFVNAITRWVLAMTQVLLLNVLLRVYEFFFVQFLKQNFKTFSIERLSYYTFKPLFQTIN